MTIQSSSDLTAAIKVLEARRIEEGEGLKKQFAMTHTSLKPSNLIKSTLRDIVGTNELKGGVVSTSLGLLASFVFNKFFMRGSAGIGRKILGTVLMFGITKIVAKHGEGISNLGHNLLSRLRRKKTNIVIEGED